jgi:putative CocE/NonD family hydrolase
MCLAASSPLPVNVELNVPMVTRDGVTLNADVYRPDAPGRFPVILRRTPYGKSPAAAEGNAAAARGYVYIAQDVRGRETSGGDWYPFVHEGKDGYDAVEWAAGLPYADGKVGMTSGSYEGIVQLYAAMEAPPHLVCLNVGVCPSDIYGQLVYDHGAFMQALAQAWSGALSVGEFNKRVQPAANPAYWAKQRPLDEYPLIDVPAPASVGRYYRDWLRHPTYDAYWQAISFERHYGQIKVPMLQWPGWYDVFLNGSLRNYTGLKAEGGSEAARRGQRMVVLPGGHAGFVAKIADVDFGAASVFPLFEHSMRWFDWHLKGIDDGISKEKPVKLFIMGDNVYRDEDDWPLARAVTTRFYLHSGGHANTAQGDGRLDLVPPADEAADQYVYDPANPVPTTGGATLGIAAPPPGPVDQRPLADRSDILAYTTEPFAQATEVTGPLSLEVHFSTSVEDTDLIGRVIDVAPDGRAILLTEGVLRLRYRESYELPILLEPGRVYAVTLDLWATANVFKAGHRLRLEVTSSSYPRYDRHPNRGGDLSGAVAPVPATMRILHDRQHPSALLLPIVPR